MANKLGIILSFHVLPNLRAAKGPERSVGTQPSDLVFLVGSGRRSVCTKVSTPLGARILWNISGRYKFEMIRKVYEVQISVSKGDYGLRQSVMTNKT